MTRRILLGLAAALVVAAAATAWGQRLLIGSWQARIDQSTATLVIVTVDADGSIHGLVHYEPPQADGFSGAPFSTRIENGGFSFRLINGTRFVDLHWCRDELCGTFYAPDDTATPVVFARPVR